MSPDAGRCPLCGAGNGCALQAAPGLPQVGTPVECWCMATDFAPGVLDGIPAALRGKACICARCAQAQAQAQG